MKKIYNISIILTFCFLLFSNFNSFAKKEDTGMRFYKVTPNKLPTEKQILLKSGRDLSEEEYLEHGGPMVRVKYTLWVLKKSKKTGELKKVLVGEPNTIHTFELGARKKTKVVDKDGHEKTMLVNAPAVIEGWELLFRQGIRVGDHIIAKIKSKYAYGPIGKKGFVDGNFKNVIPPNSVLIYEIKVLKVLR